MAFTWLSGFTVDGKVGIGTPAPGALLDVSAVTNGIIRITSTATGNGANTKLGSLEYYGNDASVPGAGIKASMYAVTEAALGDDAALVFTTSSGIANNIERVRINSAGEVGIGTDDPGTLLHVSAATSNSQLTLERTGSATGKYGIYTNTNNLYINNVDAGTYPLTILNSGSVGIGNISPSSKLDITGTTTTQKLNISDAEIDTVSNYVLVQEGQAGPEITVNGDFDVDADWTKGTGWTISGGTANSDGTSQDPIAQTMPTVVGNTYTVSFQITAITGGAVRIYAYVGASGTFTELGWYNTLGEHNVDFEFGGSNKIIRFYSTSYVGSNFVGSIDNVSVRETITVSTSVINKRVLGEAAFTDGPFLPLAGGTMTGVTQFNDHTQHGDQVQARWGAGNDLIIEHNATNSYIQNFVGDLQISNFADDKDILFRGDDGAGGLTTYFYLNGGGTNTIFSQIAKFSDNVELRFGDGNDLKIYHDTIHNYITGSTGDLTISNTGDDLVLKAADDFITYVQGSDIAIQAIGDGKVGLRYNNVEKFQTTSIGATISGSLTASTLIIQNQINTNSTNLEINYQNGDGSTTAFKTLTIRDGKNSTIASFVGSSKAVNLVGKATSAATVAADGSSTLVTKSYVDGLVTGVPVYKGTWAAGTTGVTSAAIAGTVITLTAAPTNTIAVGDIVTATGIVGLTTLVTVVTSQTSITVSASVAIAITETVTFSPEGGFPDLTAAALKILGNYYIVDTAGYATPNGATVEPDSWHVGDWAIFSDITPGVGTDLWQKIDNSSVISGAGTGGTIPLWEGTGDSVTLTDSIITKSSTSTIIVNGSLGVGTSSVPARELEVTGPGNVYIRLTAKLDTDSTAIELSNTQETWQIRNEDTNDDALQFMSDSGTQMTIERTGNVGIGPIDPDFKLDIIHSEYVGMRVESTSSGFAPASILLEAGNTDARGQGIFQYNSSSKNSWFSGVPYSTTSDDWVIAHKLETTSFNSDVAQMSNVLFCVNDTGNVGIGSTTPDSKLDIYDTFTKTAANPNTVTVYHNGNVVSNGIYPVGGQFTQMVSAGANSYGTGLEGISSKGGNYGYIATGVRGIGKLSGNVTIDNADMQYMGVEGRIEMEGSNSVNLDDRAYSFYASGEIDSGSHLKDYHGIYLNTPVNNGTILNKYGVSQVDTNSKNYFAGDVGIGAITPLRKLHVAGGTGFAVNASTSQYYGVYIPAVGEGADPRIDIGDWHNAGSSIKWDSSARSLNLDTQYSTGAGTFNITGNDGASTFLTVNSSGNVGIENTNPTAAKLVIREDTGYALRTENASGWTLRMKGDTGNLEVSGSVKMADDTAAASATNVGTQRYRTGTEYVEVTGVELVANGDFATSADWGGGATSPATRVISGGKLTIVSPAGESAYANQNILTATKTYKGTVDVVVRSGTCKIQWGTGTGATTSVMSATGTYTFYKTIPATGADGQFYLARNGSCDVDFDNASVIEVEEQDASYVDMCMQTGASTYEWVNIVQNNW